MLTNSTNLNQTDGGTLIKQGDVSSRFAYQLCDENGDFIQLTGKQAKVSIGNHGKIYFSTTVDVAEDNTVSFTIEKPLPLGTHQIEVSCDGYIFPSDKSATITVKSSHEEYAVADAIEKVHYDDTEIREGLASVSSQFSEQAEELSSLKTSVNETTTDYGRRIQTLEAKDSEQDERLSALEADSSQLPEIRSSISSETQARQESLQRVTNRLQVLEEKPDFDPSALEEQLSQLHKYDDSDLKRRLVAVEQLLIPKRCPPVGSFILDKTTKPWTIWLDNGSGLQLPDYDRGATIYGDGYTQSLNDNNVPQWPLVYQVIKLARGTINLSSFKVSNGCWTYWSPTTTVINPVCRRADYDWSNAKLMSSASSYSDRQQYLIRTMYELGLFTAKDVESLGAIKIN